MSREKRKTRGVGSSGSQKSNGKGIDNDQFFRDLIDFVIPPSGLFSKEEFHGNIKWIPEQLAAQAVILEQEIFPDNTLFCGDAGFVGYPLWSSIINSGGDFLIRVGANVDLLSELVDFKRLSDGIVLCWPKRAMEAGLPPLRLRLVQIQIGKTKMWMLTTVVDRTKLTKKHIVRYYKMRWGIEVEFRRLKQTIDKHKLRCRNDGRLLAELDWALRGMAIAELIALRQQIPAKAKLPPDYTPKDLSLAKVLRALRECMRNLGSKHPSNDDLITALISAVVQRYRNRTDKRARYRPKNPDIKPLGDPVVRKLTAEQRKKLGNLRAKNLT